MSNETHNMIFCALAQYAYDSLVSKTREDGETFLAFERDSADWLGRLAREAHNDELPNNWRYSAMHVMLEQLAQCEDEDARDEEQHEVCDSLVDVYTSDRIVWLSDNLGRIGACDDANYEDLAGRSPGISDMIAAGQYAELSATWHAIVSFLDNAVAEILEDSESVYRYTAGHNMPGFMPDSEPVAFLSFEDARDYIEALFDEHADEHADEREEHEHGSSEYIAANKKAGACLDARNYTAGVNEPFSISVAGRVYWIIDNGLSIDHDAI